ncbi:MAG: GTP-binding protein [Candidatus Tectomicrobia bacterium]|uniref:GTP-binding protein n=1 Tax=Tectimicrobiota bacterium TaxID=2528274 RepID=A0A938AZM2_UNCTE|nr:GTP-binding protein [Candidatus Tectomicrobia bacterium]
MSESTRERIPVTLVAGFLGSGKTTLVNRILTTQHTQRIAVIVNEFGEVGIDGRLVVGVEDNVVQLSNGCLCCTVRSDLVTTVQELLTRRREAVAAAAPVPFERILIEASGLASPGPAVQTLLADPRLATECQIDGVITMVNTPHIVQQIQAHPEASAQLGYADHIIANHCDQCEATALTTAEEAIRTCNPHATLERTSHAQVEIPTLLQLRTWDAATPRVAPHHGHADDTHAHTDHEHTEPHTHGVSTLLLRMQAPLDVNRLKLWLLFIVKRRSHELMRFKGILRCQGQTAAVVVQGVYQWVELRRGHDAAPAESVMVLIGRNLDVAELQREWENCQARG